MDELQRSTAQVGDSVARTTVTPIKSFKQSHTILHLNFALGHFVLATKHVEDGFLVT